MKTTITNNLRELRHKAGLLQIDVARGIGVTSSDRISECELGLRYPNVPNLYKLARFFHVSVDALYGIRDEQK